MTTTSSIPSRSSGEPKVRRAWPVCWSMPMTPRARPAKRDDEAADPRGAEDAGDRDEGEHHQREVVGRPEDEGQLGDGRRREREHERGERAGDERADRRGRERGRAPRPRRAMRLPSSAVMIAPLSPGRVQQDRRGRAAVHRAVEDAGEHDEGAGRVHLHRHREEQRDRERRADAGQDADRRPEDRADERPEEVQRLERHGEAVGELGQRVHGVRSRAAGSRARRGPGAGRRGASTPRRGGARRRGRGGAGATRTRAR